MTFKKPRIIHRLFEIQAESKPDKEALIFEGSKSSFGELNGLSNKIAEQLAELGLCKGETVALYLDSPIHMAVGMLGILKAGGSCIPLNPIYGERYGNLVLSQSRAKYLLTTGAFSPKTAVFRGQTLKMDNILRGEGSLINPGTECTPEDTMAVIYASNSSGRPEGSVLSHGYMTGWIDFNIEVLKIDFSDTVFISGGETAAVSPLVWLAVLAVGGSVCVRTLKGGSYITEPGGLAGKCIVLPLSLLGLRTNIDVFKEVISQQAKCIVSFGEDEFGAGELKSLLKEKGIRWYNYFGFPEISIVTALTEIGGGFIHTGKPVKGCRAYVLDRTGQPVSIGITGDMYTTGACVTDGYFMNDKLNEEIFKSFPFIPDARVYKTGFKAFWKEDGKLWIRGRSDARVVIGGRRFYPEEMEAILCRSGIIKDSAVEFGKTIYGEDRMTVYMVPVEAVREEDIESYLRRYLNGDMLKIGFVRLFTIPRTPEGEPDRKYLEGAGYKDTLDAKALEDEIRQCEGIENAAVIIKKRVDKLPNVHLKDCIPGFINRSLKSDGTDRKERKLSEDESKLPTAIIYGGDLVLEPKDPVILQDALLRATVRHPERGVRYIHTDGTENFQTYQEILEDAERILAGLRKAGLYPGDKVIFQFDTNEDYVRAFWGCTLGGFVPVPFTVPKVYSERSSEVATIRNIGEILDSPVIFTTQGLCGSIKPVLGGLRILTIEGVKNNERDNAWHKSDPEDMCIILFTSGSTGKPKGVVQCHRSILAREKGAVLFSNFNSEDISFNWFSMEHVVGILMFHILQVYTGCGQIHARTEYILSEPLRWLDIITKYRVSVTWAPNFAFSLVSEEVEKSGGTHWDLSSVRMVINAGETVNAASCKRFLRLLEPYGLIPTAIKPEWGMSETCSVVVSLDTFSLESEQGYHILDKNSLKYLVRGSKGGDTESVTFVEIGKPYRGTSIRIVDENNKVLRERMVGRLQIKGLTVTSGYYRNPEINASVFTDDGWFDTGDLAFIQNGSVTFTGRMKDVIIINGINYNNNEIEAIVENLEGVEVSYAVACAVRDAGSDTDKVAVFYTSMWTEFKRILEQIREIRKSVFEKIGVKVDYVIPVKREDIPKTSIGKPQRSKIGKVFESGRYDEILRKIDIGLENENTIPQWFFRKTWQRSEVRALNSASDETCLVFAGEEGLGKELIENLRTEGCRCIEVGTGSGFERINPHSYNINYRVPEDYSMLVDALEKDGLLPHSIFHLFAYDHPDTCLTDIERVKAAQEQGVYSLLHLIKALSQKTPAPVKLFTVSSCGGSPSGDGGADYRNSTITGFIKSAAAENQWLKCCHIDLETVCSGIGSGYVLSEWKNGVSDKEVAYRNGKRMVPCLSRVDILKEAAFEAPIKSGGIYIVTGGPGGVGTHVCKYLMRIFGAKLLIIGRTPLPEKSRWHILTDNQSDEPVSKRIRSIMDIESAGGEYIYAAGDVCSLPFLKEAVKMAEEKWGEPVSGVFHLAGSSGRLNMHWADADSHWAVSESAGAFRELFDAKVYGTVNLYEIIKDRPDAVFIAFSSIMGFFGSIAFSAYSAANSFIDGFCGSLIKRGCSNVYCMSWSMWDNTGISENSPSNVLYAMASNGYSSISVKEALNSMHIALRAGGGHLLIGLNGTSVNIGGYLAGYPDARQVYGVYYSIKDGTGFDEVKNKISNMLNHRLHAGETELEMYHLDSIPLNEGRVDYFGLESLDVSGSGLSAQLDLPENDTEEQLLILWKQILGRSNIGVNISFFDLGGNSLKIMRLCDEINNRFNQCFKVQDLFKLNTISKIAAEIGNSEETEEDTGIEKFVF